jgi:hypothetical protein
MHTGVFFLAVDACTMLQTQNDELFAKAKPTTQALKQVQLASSLASS